LHLALVMATSVTVSSGCNAMGSWDKSRAQMKDNLLALLPFIQARPEIRSAALAQDNSTVTINFSQGVYTDRDQTGALTPADFLLTFTQNGGTATGVTITSVDHALGTNSAVLHLSVTGIVSGVETIEIQPSNGLAIFNSRNNSMVATDTTGQIYLNDATAPTVTAVSLTSLSDADVGSVSISITFSKSMDTAINPPQTITGLASPYTITGSAWSAGNTVWTGCFTFADDDEKTVGTVNISGFRDLFGQIIVPDSTHLISVDTENPALMVDQGALQADPTNALPVNFTVMFSEAIDPTTFTAADIIQTGSATGITWDLSTADNVTWTLSAISVTGGGTIIPVIVDGTVTDVAGNGNLASTSTDNIVTYDTTAPTITVTAPNGGADFTTTTASQTVSGTCSTDAVNLATTLGTFSDSDCSDGTWALNAYTLAEGANVFTISGEDSLGNPTSDSITITLDTTPPSIAITAPNGGADFSTYTATQNISGTCSTDASLSTNTGTFADSDCSDGTWALNTVTLAEGSNTITITATDGLGNSANDSQTITLNIPTVTLSIVGSGTIYENVGTATVRATLSSAYSSDVIVNLTFGGTATLTSDYTRSGTTITIPAGSLYGDVTITGVNDSADEQNETVV
jgi:hypothetical protein